MARPPGRLLPAPDDPNHCPSRKIQQPAGKPATSSTSLKRARLVIVEAVYDDVRSSLLFGTIPSFQRRVITRP
jgi:hypothetical protein